MFDVCMPEFTKKMGGFDASPWTPSERIRNFAQCDYVNYADCGMPFFYDFGGYVMRV